MQDKLDTIVREFMAIAQIPRPSHHEEKIAAYLIQWAADRGLRVQQDPLGDVIIDKPASPGYESAPRVILQAHMDMVCVAAEGVTYDPLSDPIRVVNDGVTLTAQGTSLGADDGIGVALCLWVLQDGDLKHGPLRVLITVNEEDGMDSAAIDPQYLQADYLINLDWEWLGSLCNSSAGCDFLTLSRTVHRQPLARDDRLIQITLKGLLGGHSGVDINRGRANALVSLAGALYHLTEADIPVRVVHFTGGQAKNAIPAAAQVTLAVPEFRVGQALDCLEQERRSFENTFGHVENTAQWTVERLVEGGGDALTPQETEDLLGLLLTLPNNVHTMSPFAPGLVESSQNLGLLTMEGDTVTLSAMERSCVAGRAAEILRATRLIARRFGYTYLQGEHAPAWAVNPDSTLTPLACQIYQELTGQDMVVEPVHGGLECGAFGEKNPHLDMIAIGPTLHDVHSPKERCDLHSVRVTAELVAALLERLQS